MDRRQTVLAVSALIAAAGLLTAGPLNPPAGPVASSYKTLAEVEARMPLNPSATPGDATSVCKITQPGSYYLTGSLAGAAGKHGIVIAASGHVSIDLNGFELVGVPQSLSGITADFTTHPVTIRNGVVRGFGVDGVHASAAGSIVECVQAVGNAGSGIMTGGNANVRSCAAMGNVVYGITVSDTSVIESCTVRDNINDGIHAGQGAAITGCAAYNNASGIFLTGDGHISRCTARLNSGNGIDIQNGGIIESCLAWGNGGNGIEAGLGGSIRGCAADSNGVHGIFSSGYMTIKDNSAVDNTADGIRPGNDSIVTGSVCRGNGAGAGDGAGIHLTAPRTRVEGNFCSGNDRGIDVDVAGSFLSRNTCSGNTTNWTVVAGNECLVVSATTSGAINGSAGGVSPGSADPNANFSH